MIGSGVSRHSVNISGNVPPTWRGFLETGIKKCVGKTKHITDAIKRGQYLEACEWIKKNLDDKWIDHLRDSFVKPKFKSAEIHKHLYLLDSRIVLTPNFDKIYDGYASSESENTIVIKKHSDSGIIESIRRGDRLILKSHGTIDDVGDLIFTRKEYALARTKYSAFYKLLASLISTTTVLMIGVGLDDPDFQLLFEDHAAMMEPGLPHYMTFADKISSDAENSLRDTRNIKFLKYSAKSNHSALVSSLEKLVLKVQEARQVIAREQDW